MVKLNSTLVFPGNFMLRSSLMFAGGLSARCEKMSCQTCIDLKHSKKICVVVSE